MTFNGFSESELQEIERAGRESIQNDYRLLADTDVDISTGARIRLCVFSVDANMTMHEFQRRLVATGDVKFSNWSIVGNASPFEIVDGVADIGVDYIEGAEVYFDSVQISGSDLVNENTMRLHDCETGKTVREWFFEEGKTII